jgi:hypothetical protein
MFKHCVCASYCIVCERYGTTIQKHYTDTVLHSSVPTALPLWRLHSHVCPTSTAIARSNITGWCTLITAIAHISPHLVTALPAANYQLQLHCNSSAMSIVLQLLLLAGRCQCRERCTEPHISHKQPQLRQHFTCSYAPLKQSFL